MFSIFEFYRLSVNSIYKLNVQNLPHNIWIYCLTLSFPKEHRSSKTPSTTVLRQNRPHSIRLFWEAAL